MTEDQTKEYEEREHCLLFGIRRSIRYHISRKRFFDNLHNLSTFLTALGGTGTIATVLSNAGTGITLAFASIVTFFSLIDLIIGSPRLARLYYDLARRFTDLEKKVVLSKSLDMKFLDEVETERLDIEVDEPPHLKVLNAICNNEMLRSMGYDRKEFQKVAPIQRIFSQVWDIRPGTL